MPTAGDDRSGIANYPDVIIADEPTTALGRDDPGAGARSAEDGSSRGAAVILITHDLGRRRGECRTGHRHVRGTPRGAKAASTTSSTSRRCRTRSGCWGPSPRLDATNSEPLATFAGQPPTVVTCQPACPFVPRCPLAHAGCREREPDPRRSGPTTDERAGKATESVRST